MKQILVMLEDSGAYDELDLLAVGTPAQRSSSSKPPLQSRRPRQMIAVAKGI